MPPMGIGCQLLAAVVLFSCGTCRAVSFEIARRVRKTSGSENAAKLFRLEEHMAGSVTARVAMETEAEATALQHLYRSAVFDWQTVQLHVSGGDAKKHASLLATVAAPSLAVVLGLLLTLWPLTRTAGKLVLFFGGQCYMTLYIKSVLADTEVSQAQGMYGFPAPFAVTALQLVTSFLCMVFVIVLSWATPWPYTPKVLRKGDAPAILGLALAFSANISLNNMSLTMLDISVNQVIRSGGPVAILIVSFAQATITSRPMKKYSHVSYFLLLASVLFAAATVLVKSSGHLGTKASAMLIPGIVVCVCSVLASASNVLVVAFLGSDLKLSPMDSVFYMSLPSALLLVLPACYVSHLMPWEGAPPMTDVEVLRTIWALRPLVICVGGLSGVFAMLYNVLMYSIIQSMSAMAVEVASNFNKAATIALAMFVGLEGVPTEGVATLLAMIAGNILSVTLFGVTEKVAQMRELRNDMHCQSEARSLD